jgi:hypothetical protein
MANTIDGPEVRLKPLKNRPVQPLADIGGEGAAMLLLDGSDHVLRALPDMTLHHLVGAGRESEFRQNFGIHPAGEGFGIHQHAVAIVDHQHLELEGLSRFAVNRLRLTAERLRNPNENGRTKAAVSAIIRLCENAIAAWTSRLRGCA